MKRILIYIGILLVLWFVPVKGADLAQMHPVEVVHVYREGKSIVIETDTEDRGIGVTATQALTNLKETTSGFIYLDTAQYLLLTRETEETVEELRPHLKKSVQLCYGEIGVDLKEAARFLPSHSRLPQLKQWEVGVDLPYLTTFEKRLKMS